MHNKLNLKFLFVSIALMLFLNAGSALAVGAGSKFSDPTIGMEFVPVPGGCFRMGDSFGDGQVDELPVHEVCVDGFNMGKYAVTVGEFRKFVAATGYRTDAEKSGGCFTEKPTGGWSKILSANWMNTGFHQTDRHPVVCITWNDAAEFNKWLSKQSKRTYRLPTEAEWEYAARGNTSGRNYWGNSVNDACEYANVNDRSTSTKTKLPRRTIHGCDDGYVYTSPVGSFKPNAFGLYDMMGNIWQWTEDWYVEEYYEVSPRINPQGPISGESHGTRGGSWRSSSEHLRTSLRIHPPNQSAGVGFRLVTPSQK